MLQRVSRHPAASTGTAKLRFRCPGRMSGGESQWPRGAASLWAVGAAMMCGSGGGVASAHRGPLRDWRESDARLERVEERARCQGPCSGRPSQGEQVLIAGDDDVGAAGMGRPTMVIRRFIIVRFPRAVPLSTLLKRLLRCADSSRHLKSGTWRIIARPRIPAATRCQGGRSMSR